MDNVDDDDEFWSVAMLPPNRSNHSDVNGGTVAGGSGDDQNEEITSAIQFTILPPNPSQIPLTLNLQMNCNDGVLSDVSGVPWDAALLLSGFLFGTYIGRQLCYDAPSVLELGSGLGIVGMSATAAALSMHSTMQNIEVDSIEGNNNNIDQHNAVNKSNETKRRVVLTDRNDDQILDHLRKNVAINLDRIAGYAQNNQNDLWMTIEPCDWMDVSNALSDSKYLPVKESFPRGPFNLILGSALVYLPEHACACADTLFYYLTCDVEDDLNCGLKLPKRQAVILQLPDRAGFTTHFLPRCHEFGLTVSCHQLDKTLIERVQQGWNRSIPSAGDYRLYFIATK